MKYYTRSSVLAPSLSLLLALKNHVVVVQSLTRGESLKAPVPRSTVPRQAMESLISLKERRECVPFADIPEALKISEKSDVVCMDDGGCAADTSCCRVSSWLECDDSNSFAFLPCICNDFTRTHRPSHAPSFPPTMQPSQQPTASPTTAPPASTELGNIFDENDKSQINKQTEEDDDWLNSPAMVGGVAAGMVVFFFVLFMVARKRRQRQRKMEFLQRADLDLIHQMEIETHLDFHTASVSEDCVVNAQPDGFHRIDKPYPTEERTRTYQSEDTVYL